jgi:hypothetical protein
MDNDELGVVLAVAAGGPGRATEAAMQPAPTFSLHPSGYADFATRRTEVHE